MRRRGLAARQPRTWLHLLSSRPALLALLVLNTIGVVVPLVFSSLMLSGIGGYSDAALAALGGQPETMFQSREEAYQTRQMRDTLQRELAAEQDRANPHIPHLASLQAAVQDIDQKVM